MNWVDIIIVAYIFLGALSGLRRGLVLVLFSLAGYVAGVLIAERYQGMLTTLVLAKVPVSSWLARWLPVPALDVPGAQHQAANLAHTLTALVVFLLVVGLTEYAGRLVGQMVTRMVRSFRVTGFVNSLGGGVAGLAEHGVVVGLVLTLVSALPMLAHSPLFYTLHRDPLAMTLMGWFGHIVKLPGGTFL